MSVAQPGRSACTFFEGLLDGGETPPPDAANLGEQALAFADLICPCGDGPEAAVFLLREFLDAYGPHDTLAGYLNLNKQGYFAKEHGDGVWHLVHDLLQNLGFVNHFGSCTSSSFLTDAGGGLKYCTNLPGFIEMAYKER